MLPIEKGTLKYPVRIAVMEVEHRKDYTWETETFGYVVAPCSVIKDIKNYYADGTSKIQHEVVFTWKPEYYRGGDMNIERTNELRVPEFNCYICTNSDLVDKVYTNRETCQIQANKMNERLRYADIGYLPFESKEQFERDSEELLAKFDNDLKEIEEYAKTRLNDNPNIEVGE